MRAPLPNESIESCFAGGESIARARIEFLGQRPEAEGFEGVVEFGNVGQQLSTRVDVSVGFGVEQDANGAFESGDAGERRW